jgi:hypothetical protein
MWGALLVIQAYAVFTESDRNIQRGDLVLLALPVSAMALLFCARDVLAYLRTRRSPEVRR